MVTKSNIIFIVCLLVLTIALSCKSSKIIKQGSIFRYRRDTTKAEVSQNGITSVVSTELSDIVAITEYQNETLTCDSFVQIMRSYLDTAKGNLPISVITFIGQKHGELLPNLSSEAMDELENHKIIGFGFKKSSSGMDITLIGIYNKKGNYPIIFQKGQPGEISSIDSIIHSKIPL